MGRIARLAAKLGIKSVYVVVCFEKGVVSFTRIYKTRDEAELAAMKLFCGFMSTEYPKVFETPVLE